MKLTSVPNPLYERKIFWVDEQLVTFEFGEYRLADAAGEITATWLIATYVWHKTDATGNPTGTTAYQLLRVKSREEGQQLLEAATEAGAAAWLQAQQQWEKAPGLLVWLQTHCRRQFLHRLWQWRRWKRLKYVSS